MLKTPIGARAGAAIAGVVIGLGAASVAGYAATRPASETVTITPGAATPSPKAKPSDGAVGPDATGPAAKGLCNAWANHQKHQDGVERAEGSVAMRNLAAAAGGDDKIAAYCATIPHPGKGPRAGKGPKPADDDGDEAARPDKPGKPTKPGKGARSATEPSASTSTSATPDPTATPTPSSTAPSPSPSAP